MRYAHAAETGWASLMLRTCSRVIALTAMVTCGLVTAQAADTTLTLACQGTTTIFVTETPKVLPISMGIIVNLTKRTFEGLEALSSIPVEITSVNEVTISFQGFNRDKVLEENVRGSIDRVTGDFEAITTMKSVRTMEITSTARHSLKCRPTQRMF